MNNIEINGIEVFPIGVNFYVSRRLDVFQFNSFLKVGEHIEEDSVLEHIKLDEAKRKISFYSTTKRGKKIIRSTYFLPYSRIFSNMNWEEYKRALKLFLEEYATIVIDA